jgi:putative serine protease PepD
LAKVQRMTVRIRVILEAGRPGSRSRDEWRLATVTDGWNWRQPPPPGGSPWWSDALNDPWRDPYAPTAVVLPTAPPDLATMPERVEDPDRPVRRTTTPILMICLITALLAGALGGTLGYVFAVRGGVGAPTALGATRQQDTPASVQRPPDSLAGVANRVLPSVVTVRVAGAVGSGFVASADGYVITNDHVVEGASGGTATVLFSDGSIAGANVVGHDTESDIAVIKVAKSGLPPVQFGDSDKIAVGDSVLAIGAPLALSNTVTAGIVSALDRTLQAGEGGQTRYYAAIQTDAAVNQGNSGGPLVDATGKVVGVNSVIRSLSADSQEAGNIGLAFAIPINQAKRVAQEIIDTGKARRTVIGAEVSTTPSTAAGGVKISSVQAGGPAAAAGLKAGDVIFKIDGRVLEEGVDLIALVRKYAPGAVVSVEYQRGTANQKASVTLAADAK